MAKQQLVGNSGSEFLSVDYKGSSGGVFVGKLVSRADNKGLYKKTVWELTVSDSTLPITKKENGEYVAVDDVQEGALVSIWGCTSLDTALSQAKIGDMLEISYEGLKKNPKPGRKAFHSFKVFKLDGE